MGDSAGGSVPLDTETRMKIFHEVYGPVSEVATKYNVRIAEAFNICQQVASSLQNMQSPCAGTPAHPYSNPPIQAVTLQCPQAQPQALHMRGIPSEKQSGGRVEIPAETTNGKRRLLEYLEVKDIWDEHYVAKKSHSKIALDKEIRPATVKNICLRRTYIHWTVDFRKPWETETVHRSSPPQPSTMPTTNNEQRSGSVAQGASITANALT